MRRFRKRPVVIEAEQFIHEGDAGITEMWDESDVTSCKHCNRPMRLHGRVPTLEGYHIACPGDWIIIGIKGERYPCKPDIFEATYEEVS